MKKSLQLEGDEKKKPLILPRDKNGKFISRLKDINKKEKFEVKDNKDNKDNKETSNNN